MFDWLSGLKQLFDVIGQYIPDFIKNLFSAILDAITEFFNAVGRGFASLFQAEVHIVDNLNSIVTDFEIAKANIEVLVEKIEQFQLLPNWDSRVINVPAALKGLQELQKLVIHGFRDKFKELLQPIHDLKLIFKAEEIEANTPQGQVSGVARTAAKVDEIATMIQQIATAMHTVQDFSQMANDVIDKLNGLDVLFLSQGTPRKSEVLLLGSGERKAISLRAGHLHQGI